MGKGDRKTYRGKLFRKSYGNKRPRRKKKSNTGKYIIKLFYNKKKTFSILIPSFWKYSLIDNKIHTFKDHRIWIPDSFQISMNNLDSEEKNRKFAEWCNSLEEIEIGEKVFHKLPDSNSDGFITQAWVKNFNSKMVMFTFTFLDNPDTDLDSRTQEEKIKLAEFCINSFKLLQDSERKIHGILEEDFIQKIKEIWFYAAQYGAYTATLKTQNTKEIVSPEMFTNGVRDGFKIAQSIILKELKELALQQENSKIIIAEARKSNQDLMPYTTYLKHLEYKERIIRNLAYTIAWQIVDGKRENLARLYTGESGSKDLEGSGFDELINQVNDINTNPNSFALILDLTENLQIGDLMIDRFNHDYSILEVKSGEKNKESREIIEELKKKNIPITKAALEANYDPTFIKQILRMHKQDVKQERYEQIKSTDIGPDPKNEGITVYHIDPIKVDDKYHSIVTQLLSSTDNSSLTTVDDCVNIGIFKKEARVGSRAIMEKINNGYPIYSLTNSIGIALVEPLFVKFQYEWSHTDILDIISGNTIVYVGIDMDKYINLAKTKGVNLRWSSRKEKHEIFEDFKKVGANNSEIFTHNNKCIIFEDENLKGCVGYGQLFRIIYDQFLPSCLLENRVTGLGELNEI